MKLFLPVLFLFAISKGFSQAAECDLLFLIERNRDKNVIHYAINLDEDGNLIKENPIRIYWVKNEEDKSKRQLTWVQEKYAYGLKFLNTETFPIEFQFVSYKKKSLFLDKNKDGYLRVFTFASENNDMVELNRIFIQIDGGSFWFPSIARVELHAILPHCNTGYAEIIIP